MIAIVNVLIRAIGNLVEVRSDTPLETPLDVRLDAAREVPREVLQEVTIDTDAPPLFDRAS